MFRIRNSEVELESLENALVCWFQNHSYDCEVHKSG